MNLTRKFSTVALAALMTASTALAADNRASFDLPQASILEGVELAKGSYKVEWQGSGADVEVTIKQGGRELVRTHATLTDLGKTQRLDTASLEPGEEGAMTLVGMKFSGKRQALRFAAASAQKKTPARSSDVARR